MKNILKITALVAYIIMAIEWPEYFAVSLVAIYFLITWGSKRFVEKENKKISPISKI